MGRPIAENPRNKAIKVRFTERDYQMVEQAAKRCGMTLSQFIRGNVVTAASLIAGKKVG